MLPYDVLSHQIAIPDFHLPWPSGDYTSKMSNFLRRHPGLVGITIQTRDDALFGTLQEFHSKSLKKLYIEEAWEGTDPATFFHNLSKLTELEELILYAQDSKLLVQELFDVISGLPALK